MFDLNLPPSLDPDWTFRRLGWGTAVAAVSASRASSTSPSLSESLPWSACGSGTAPAEMIERMVAVVMTAGG